MKKQINEIHCQQKRKSTKSNPEMTQVSVLEIKDFRVDILSNLNEVKQNIFTIERKIGNLSREIKII